MTITNRQSGTNVHEVAEGIYRINTPVVIEGAGGFSFNQYLIVDDAALLEGSGRLSGHLITHRLIARD
jgi:hypothetical protein